MRLTLDFDHSIRFVGKKKKKKKHLSTRSSSLLLVDKFSPS